MTKKENKKKREIDEWLVVKLPNLLCLNNALMCFNTALNSTFRLLGLPWTERNLNVDAWNLLTVRNIGLWRLENEHQCIDLSH